MQIMVSGKQLDVGEALRGHVEDKLSALVTKYFGRPIDASCTFSREAHLYRTDCGVHFGANLVVQVHAMADEIYASFDVALERLEKRLRRWKRRLKDHHANHRAEPATPAQSYVLAPEAEDTVEEEADGTAPDGAPVVIAETRTNIETLSVREAVMRLDLGDLPALMFRNGADGGLNVVYRRQDGNIGWIEPAAVAAAT